VKSTKRGIPIQLIHRSQIRQIPLRLLPDSYANTASTGYERASPGSNFSQDISIRSNTVQAGLRDRNMETLRQEILGLLRQQMQALDSPGGLTDEQLRECYLRQNRVQELREILQAACVSPLESSQSAHVQSVPEGDREQEYASPATPDIAA
jgi:hypothetical protein